MPRKRYLSQIEAEKRRDEKHHIASIRFTKDDYSLFESEAARRGMSTYGYIHFCATRFLKYNLENTQTEG